MTGELVRLAMKRATTANPIEGLPYASTLGTYRARVFPKIG
jgi:hypothetical protein